MTSVGNEITCKQEIFLLSFQSSDYSLSDWYIIKCHPKPHVSSSLALIDVSKLPFFAPCSVYIGKKSFVSVYSSSEDEDNGGDSALTNQSITYLWIHLVSSR